MNLFSLIPEDVRRKAIGGLLFALGASGWFGWAYCTGCQARAQQTSQDLWGHIYHPARLRILQVRAIATGTIVDASHGKNKDGCRHEADGDGHCFLRLDSGQDSLLNKKNIDNEDGNLVFEPICRYRVTQQDAMEACKNWKQDLILPPVGSHVRISGSSVLDTQHGHKEFHPVFSIEVIP